jgi:hypothetical protein
LPKEEIKEAATALNDRANEYNARVKYEVDKQEHRPPANETSQIND